MHTKFWLESLKGRDQSEDLVIDGKIILEQISGKQGGKEWTGQICLRMGGPMAGSCELGNEPSSSIKIGEFLVQLGVY
jgi:hypothetical protein